MIQGRLIGPTTPFVGERVRRLLIENAKRAARICDIGKNLFVGVEIERPRVCQPLRIKVGIELDGAAEGIARPVYDRISNREVGNPV